MKTQSVGRPQCMLWKRGTSMELDMENLQNMVEERLLELPVVQYAWLKEEEIPFSDRVREICRNECPRYGTSWSCPPGVGTVKECRDRCAGFPKIFVFTTIAEVADAADMTETLATRGAHEEITKEIREIFGRAGCRTMALSADSCAICEKCAYPDAPCRHPGRMLPCLESYGIIVPELAQKAGIEFMNGANIVTWFGMILFTDQDAIRFTK